MEDLALTDWSRAQFALTALYHWLFVPITLGLSFLCAFFETIYVRTGNEEWKRLTKFWMTLFGINFVLGVATGITMEFARLIQLFWIIEVRYGKSIPRGFLNRITTRLSSGRATAQPTLMASRCRI